MFSTAHRKTPATGPLIALLLLATLFAADAGAAKLGFFDDDWDPVQRGRSYLDDPGYEMWIRDALESAGLQYDYFEIQPTPDETVLPDLDTLIQYPLIIWNCAAETENALSFAERMLLRNYLDLGGKVVLLGQGILNSFDLSDPEVEDFVHDVLSLSDFILDVETETLFTDGCFYFDALAPAALNFAPLPDPFDTGTDHLIPRANAFSFVHGSTGGMAGLVSTDTYRPHALHFQSALVEAIDNPAERGAWLRSITEWLGLEGDRLVNFLGGTDDFTFVAGNSTDLLGWSPAENAMVFSSSGSPTGAVRWAFDVGPADEALDWRMGFAAQIQTSGDNAAFVPFELAGRDDLVRLSFISDPENAGQAAIRCEIVDNGVALLDDAHLDVPPGTILRAQVAQTGMPPRLRIGVADQLGYEFCGWTVENCVPDFNRLNLYTVPFGADLRAPIEGWLDDYFFEGDLTFTPTVVTETPAPSARLLAAHPNPFNPSTTLSVAHPEAGAVALRIFDLAGRTVRTLHDGHRAAGDFQMVWDGRDAAGARLPSGLYLARVESSAGNDTARLIMLK